MSRIRDEYMGVNRDFWGDRPTTTISFTKYISPPKPSTFQRIVYMLQRTGIYRWYVFRRYGTKVTIERITTLTPKR